MRALILSFLFIPGSWMPVTVSDIYWVLNKYQYVIFTWCREIRGREYHNHFINEEIDLKSYLTWARFENVRIRVSAWVPWGWDLCACLPSSPPHYSYHYCATSMAAPGPAPWKSREQVNTFFHTLNLDTLKVSATALPCHQQASFFFSYEVCLFNQFLIHGISGLSVKLLNVMWICIVNK